MESQQKQNLNLDLPLLRSCEKEAVEPIEGKITGTIPLWLNGALFCNGQGQLQIGECKFQHLFDGMAFLKRFEIKDGKVTFQCRFLQSDAYIANNKANRIVFTDFGTSSVPDPCQSIFQRFFSFFEKKDICDNANISLYPFGDELYSFSETPFMFKIDKETLETKKKIDLRSLNVICHTSHPHVTEDGTVYNLALTNRGSLHSIVRFVNKPKKEANDYSMYDEAEIVASIPVRWSFFPSYMHSFGITTNYFVILEQPATLSMPNIALAVLRNSPVIDCLKFYPKELVQISVISRSTGKLSYKFYSDAFFYFHIINQYEDEDHIVLDVCSYDNNSLFDMLKVESLKSEHVNQNYCDLFRSTVIRLVLPLVDTSDNKKLDENLVKLENTTAKAFLQENGTILAMWEVLTSIGCDLPTINYNKYRGLKYQYFYSISTSENCNRYVSIAKVNIKEKTAERWYEANCYPNEPIFVPKPDAKTEDDGVVLSSLVWGLGDKYRTGLVILDAKTMKEIGRAEFNTPGSNPTGFHGWYSTN